jgi:hypothetical protein
MLEFRWKTAIFCNFRGRSARLPAGNPGSASRCSSMRSDLRLARPGGRGTPLQRCPKTARSNSAYGSRIPAPSESEITWRCPCPSAGRAWYHSSMVKLKSPKNRSLGTMPSRSSAYLKHASLFWSRPCSYENLPDMGANPWHFDCSCRWACNFMTEKPLSLADRDALRIGTWLATASFTRAFILFSPAFRTVRPGSLVVPGHSRWLRSRFRSRPSILLDFKPGDAPCAHSLPRLPRRKD